MSIAKEITELKENFAAFMQEVKQRFSDEAPAAPAAFMEATLVDGTVVMFPGEMPEVGAPLAVKGVDGETPAPDGTHETEGGVLITTVDGIITEVAEKEVETEVETEAQFASLEQFETIMAENAKMAERIAQLEQTIVSVLGKVEESFTAIEKVANQTPEPAAKPFGFQKVEKDEALSGLAAAFKSLNN